MLVTPLLGGWLGARGSLRAVLTLAAVLNAAGCLGLLTLTSPGRCCCVASASGWRSA